MTEDKTGEIRIIEGGELRISDERDSVALGHRTVLFGKVLGEERIIFSWLPGEEVDSKMILEKAGVA